MKDLTLPLSHEDIAGLRLGELVTVSGGIWTGRAGVCKKIVEEKAPFPLDTGISNVALHSGPIVKLEADNTYTPKAISITTGVRFNAWEPRIIEQLHLRAVISKGRVGKETKAAMKRFGCVHLCRTGTFAGAFALKIRKVLSVHWLELGNPEALWHFDFDRLGPLIVETDIQGNSYYDGVTDGWEDTVARAYRRLGIEGFAFAEK